MRLHTVIQLHKAAAASRENDFDTTLSIKGHATCLGIHAIMHKPMFIYREACVSGCNTNDSHLPAKKKKNFQIICAVLPISLAALHTVIEHINLCCFQNGNCVQL